MLQSLILSNLEISTLFSFLFASPLFTLLEFSNEH